MLHYNLLVGTAITSGWFSDSSKAWLQIPAAFDSNTSQSAASAAYLGTGLQNVTTGAAETITNSLKFRAPGPSYLTRTPTVDGNRRTFTISAWVKRSRLGGGSSGTAQQDIFSTCNGSSTWGDPQVSFAFTGLDELYFDAILPGVVSEIRTTSVYRDPTAWYHVMVAMDSTASIAIMYANGIQVGSVTIPTNAMCGVNMANVVHRWGDMNYGQPHQMDGYLSDCRLIDGAALTPTSFGKFDVNGVWVPIAYNFGKLTPDGTVFGNMTNGVSMSVAFDGVLTKRDYSATPNGPVTGGYIGKSFVSSTTLTSMILYASGLTSPSFEDGGVTNSTYIYGSNTLPISAIDGSLLSSETHNITDYPTQVVHTFSPASFKYFWVTIGQSGGVGVSLSCINQIVYLGYSSHTQFYGTNGHHLEFKNAAALGTDTSGSHNGSVGVSTYGTPTWNIGYGYSGGAMTLPATFVEWLDVLTNGWTATKIEAYASSSENMTLYILQRNSAGNYTVLHSQVFTHPGGGWYGPTLSTPFLVPSTGTYCVGWYSTGGLMWGYGYSDRGYGGFINGTMTGTVSGVTEFTNSGVAHQVTYTETEANNYTAVGFVSSDQVIDTPTNNYCTLNSLTWNGSGNVTSGNLVWNGNGSGSNPTCGATMYPSSGKWYWEVVQTTYYGCYVGFSRPDSAALISGGYVGGDPGSWALNTGNGTIWSSGSQIAGGVANTTNGTVYGFAWDADNGKGYISVNGVWKNSGNPVSGANPAFSGQVGVAIGPCIGAQTSGIMTCNFGQTPFAYTPPTGFVALCTSNLPVVAITKPSNYHNELLYTGNGGTQVAKTGVGFQPDLVWIKCRSAAYYHTIVDSVRGAINCLRSEQTAAEAAQGLVSIDSDGFTLPGSGQSGWAQINDGHSYVAWTWKKGSTPGFDIITDLAVNVAENHSLGAVPAFMIAKERNYAPSTWAVYHKSITSPSAGQYLQLCYTTGAVAHSNVFTSVNSTSVTCGVGLYGGSADVLLYLWAEVPGFSKFGKYTGNGNDDGPFIHLNFKLRYLMIKRTDTTGEWIIYDTIRRTYNPNSTTLIANTSAAEDTISYAIDVVANGFKIRTGAYIGMNASGGTYIYAAFADLPFGGNNVSPITASAIFSNQVGVPDVLTPITINLTGPTFIGKYFTSPVTFNDVKIYATTDGGFTNGSQGQTIKLDLYGSNDLPTTDGTAGTLIATTGNFVDANGLMKEFQFTNTTYKYWWVYFNNTYRATLAEMVLQNLSPAYLTVAPSGSNTMNVTGSSEGTTSYGSDLTFTVTNTGQLPSSVISMSLTDGTNFEFHGGTLSSGSSTLGAGSSGTVIVRPKANTNVSYSTDLVITSTNVQTVAISGASSGFTPKKFVMVGSAPGGALSTIYISSDAVNWTTVTNTPFSGQQIWDITKSTDTGLYAACCHGGFVGVSTDCITWTIPVSQPLSAATANAEYWYSSIAYGNGVFITIGGWHGIYGLRSTDNGVTWTDISSYLGPIGGVNGKTIKFGNGVFVAHGYGGPICWSTDGLTWTSSGQIASGYGDINFSTGLSKFIYGGEAATGGSLNYYVSSDGKTWTTGTSIGSYDSAASNSKLFLLGPGGMSYSLDGTTWIDKSSTWPAVGNAGNSNNPAFMASETVWITGSASSPNVYKSTDNGNTWTIVSGVTFGAGSSQSDYVAMARYI